MLHQEVFYMHELLFKFEGNRTSAVSFIYGGLMGYKDAEGKKLTSSVSR